MGRASHLLHRIHRRYQTVSETLALAGTHIHFTRIADPDAVLDQVAEAEDRLEKLSGKRATSDQLHLPYWAELWDSARGVAELLPVLKSASPHPILSVLDLGCGMGLAGTVAAKLGMRVLFADLEPDALLFAQLNSA